MMQGPGYVGPMRPPPVERSRVGWGSLICMVLCQLIGAVCLVGMLRYDPPLAAAWGLGAFIGFTASGVLLTLTLEA
jgi:hypothetical protein